MQTIPAKITNTEATTTSNEIKYVDHSQHISPVHQLTDLIASQQQIKQDNIWVHIRNDVKLGDHTKKSVQSQLQKLSNNQHFFDLMGGRAKPYLFHITNELEKREMPLYLALLPVIESGYRPDAISSWNAAGLWQFIPSTGKYFGLKQNWWYDGRCDVLASTQAALDYLQQLYGRFGDWQLALAAYNSGEATVANAIKKNEKLGKSTDFWSLDLPPETRQYIPKLIALETVIAAPSDYGIKLPDIPNQPALKPVNTGGQIQLEKAAELANIDIEKLKKFNTGFRRWATDPDGPHQLLVPIESADRFEFAISILPGTERVRWRHHKIKAGESLWSIAKKYKISISLLKKTNQLQSEKLRIGKSLLIPAATFPEAIVSATPEEPSIEIPDLEDNKYLIKSGDTLWLIARRFDIHVQQILKWNNISKDHPLKPGDELKILSHKPILEAAAL